MNHLSVIKTVFGWIAVICMGRNAIVIKKELFLSNDWLRIIRQKEFILLIQEIIITWQNSGRTNWAIRFLY